MTSTPDKRAEAGLLERARQQIRLGKATGADGGGTAPHNIYVIAEELLNALATPPEPARKAGATKATGIDLDLEDFARLLASTVEEATRDGKALSSIAKSNILRWTNEIQRLAAAPTVSPSGGYPGIREAIDAKMAKNRARQWRLNGDGTGYHVKPPTAPASPAEQGEG